MEHFAKMTVIGQMGNKTDRVFNLRYVKTIEPSSDSVLLFGNQNPFKVTHESMRDLLKTLFLSREDDCL